MQGTANSGHYYSFIKERDGGGKWLEANDTNMLPFDPDDIPRECFGGPYDPSVLDRDPANAAASSDASDDDRATREERKVRVRVCVGV